MSDAVSEKPLVILMSRGRGREDEWKAVWGFSAGQTVMPEELIAFIRQGEAVVFLKESELAEFDLSSQLGADVWVINGFGLRGDRRQELYRALDKIAWKDLKRGVVMKIHRGGGNTVAAQDYRERIDKVQFENTRWLLKQAVDYSLDIPADPEHPVTVLANVVKNDDWGRYPEALKMLGAVSPGWLNELQAVAPHVRISLIKHTFQNILQPISIDLQGLVETGFRSDYWKEVSAGFRGGKLKKRLARAKALLYGPAGAHDTVEAVIAAAGGGEELLVPWQRIKELFPEHGNLPGELAIIVDTLGTSDGEAVKAYFKGGDKHVRDWVADLEVELGKLRQAIRVSKKNAGKTGEGAGG